MPRTDDNLTVLKRLAAATPVTRFLGHRDFLKALYDGAKAVLPHYSYLKFADDLGFSATNVLRLVIIGQRPLTEKAAERITKALGLTGATRSYFLTLVAHANERAPAERDALFQKLLTYKTHAAPTALSPLQAEYFGAWYHPVIREMTALPDFRGDPEWIKARLAFPLRVDEIKRSLALLTELGVVAIDPLTGQHRRTAARITTDAEVDDLALVRFHQMMIEAGRDAITTIDESRRDVRAVTVSLPASLLPLLKGKIEAWVSEIAAMEDAEGAAPSTDVVQVNMQMFTFTKPRSGGDRQ
jgi:uncharacterized protein (TIGR02147 family)